MRFHSQQTAQINDRKTGSADMDRGLLDDKMLLDEQAPLGNQTCDDDRQNGRGHSIVKDHEDLEVQKAEFKKIQDDYRKQIHEFEEAAEEFKDEVMVHKMQIHQIVTNSLASSELSRRWKLRRK